MAKSFNEITFKYKTNFIDRVSFFVSIFLISTIGLSIFSLLNSGFKSEDAFLTNEDIFEIIKFTFVQSFFSVFLSLLLGFLGAKILFDIKSVLFKKICYFSNFYSFCSSYSCSLHRINKSMGWGWCITSN